ncbi:SDR family NAD(P)-dependent oxidoreductase [Paenibacillus tuaregi]|uniref:SDR family NAD(P)-dependent oxidoreductase n=1 Tax=Paenibacillus tuaregi TaxID=1816681 RepID=UPI0008384132|nr:glucose 1-dehydrogenase [Paenibacillus tuaregi]
MGRLADKVVIITGAAMGQGAEEARMFAKEGAKIVATDLQIDQLHAIVQEIKDNGGEAIGVKHNVASEEDWKNVVAQAVEHFGRVNVLVNNAGITTAQGFDQFDMAGWNKILEINLTGTMLGMQAVVPEMRKLGSGSIVNISSIAGLVAMSGTNGYSASKGAVTLISKTAAMELAKDSIRVNSVHPGVIMTPMVEKAVTEEAMKGLKAGTLLPRMGRPEDIAYGVLYLASDESAFVTGTQLVIDGGWTAR